MADKTGYIGRNPNDSAVTVARQFFTASGVTTAFTFASGYLTGYLDVYVDGVKKRVADEFTATDGSTFDVLQGGVGAGSTVEAVAYKAFNAAAVSGDITGNFDVSGNTTLGGSLDVTGGTTVTNLVVTGISTLGTGTTVGFANTAFNLGGTPNISVDLLSAVDINVSGAATIGGVLTYEDVTNIDSIGIVTARTGIEVTANGLVVNAGVSTLAADLSIADKIVHTGDTNTAIRFPSADTITAETAGVERLRIDSTGDVGLVGIATATGLVVVAGSGIYAGHTGIITAVTFDGNVTGNVTGDVTGALDLNGGVLTLDADADTTITADTDDQIDIAFGGNDRITLSTGLIDLKNDGSQSALRLYCEVSNAHYAALQAPAHSAFSGNITLTLPATTDTLIGRTTTDTLTNKTLTSPTITGTGNIAGTFTGNVTGTASNASGATGDFSIADKIIHTGDTNTAIRFPAADTFTVETAGSERLRINSSGITTIASGSFAIPSVPEANTDNTELPVLFQTQAGTIDGGSGLSYNPAQDVLSVNGLICSSQIVRTSGSNQLTLTTANGNGQSDIRINSASVALVGGGTVRLEVNPSGVVNTGVTTFSSTSHIKVPVGTTAQRPSGGAGDFRYNSTTGGFEGYTDEWGAIAGGGGFTTAAHTVSNDVVHIALSAAQDHKITATGICTIFPGGGTEGDSHTIRIINSGISTVGFSTQFLFPSGSVPSLPTASGAISIISFTVNKVGVVGIATELLSGASLNYS